MFNPAPYKSPMNIIVDTKLYQKLNLIGLVWLCHAKLIPNRIIINAKIIILQIITFNF
jgi:hypothetical protein